MIHIQLILLCVCVSHSVVSDSATPWTVARQTPLSMGLSRQEYWSELPCPPPGYLPNLETEPKSPALQADSLPAEPQGNTRESVRKVKNRIFCNLIIEVISHQFCYILLVTKFSLYLRRRDYRWVWVTGGSGGLVARLCPILCDPMDCRPPGYSVYEISQARILEWVDISFSSEVKVIRHLLQILTFLRKN